MKERPILFSGEMVKAIIDGRKTQTRRVVSRLAGFGPITEFQSSTTKGYDWQFRDKRGCWNDISHERLLECCPYGKPGDGLWVKETWWCDAPEPVPHDHPLMFYRANQTGTTKGMKWTSSRFMPRWASRISLLVKDVRVERLQDISESDCEAEGVERLCERFVTPGSVPISYTEIPFRDYFELLWDSINAKKHPWSENPWVWVVEFEQIPR